MKPKKTMLMFVSLLGAAMSASAAPKQNPVETIPTVAKLDLARFEGTWYELSRIPIPIARDWVNTADIYVHNADGTWSVRYEGNKGSASGPRKVLKQKLRIPDPARPGDMEVSFIPFVWMKYRLIYMSDDFRFMLVGSSSMDYLWLMSREARPTDAEYHALVAKAASLGYEASRLERVSQNGN